MQPMQTAIGTQRPMSADPINIAAYLQRIGYDGPANTRPNLETLKRIQLNHACTIPFENLDVLLCKPISLDPQSIERKLVNTKRGGYCFEQNGFMIHVLQTLGYQVEPISARVRFASPRDFTPPRTHLFAKVTLDHIPWLVDVGVGGLTPTAPFRMDTHEPQHTPHDTRRVVRDEQRAVWFHQVKLGDDWNDVCEFTGEHMPMIDRQVANWWTSTHPESKFRQSIMAAIASPDGSRHTLATRQYTHRRDGEVLESINIESSQQLMSILKERFGIELPMDTLFGIDGL